MNYTISMINDAESFQNSSLQESDETMRHTLQRRNIQLAALNQAALSIAGEVALDKVLQQIVDSARQLLNAQYAALGVPTGKGKLEPFIFSGMSQKHATMIQNHPKGIGLLGAIYMEDKPIRISQIEQDHRSSEFPEGHPSMNSFLGVPVVAGKEILGNLYLTNKLGADEFNQEDEEMLILLAAHAAIAIQNARLYEQVGRLAIIEERTRIGMDLHDGIIQSIYAVGLTLESAKLTLREDEDVEETDLFLTRAIKGLNETIRDIRNFILDLRPHRFRGNLRQGLARLIREFQANSMVAVVLSASEGSLDDLSTPIARALFLTSQEALANIARHARAQEVTINIERTSSKIEIEITDDGRGFDMKTHDNRIGHGLSNMQARINELNGRFSLTSTLNKGTTIQINLPLE